MKGLKFLVAGLLVTFAAHAGGFFSDLKNTDWTETAKTYFNEGKTFYQQNSEQIKDAGGKLIDLYKQNQAKPNEPTKPATQPKSTMENALKKLEQAQLLQQQAAINAQNIAAKATVK